MMMTVSSCIIVSRAVAEPFGLAGNAYPAGTAAATPDRTGDTAEGFVEVKVLEC